MNVNIPTQVRPSPEHFSLGPPLDVQINNLLAAIADASGKTECGDGLADLSTHFELATAFRQRYLLLQAEVQRAHDQIRQIVSY
jgi:hypothetical protein